jgi:peptidoglycan L-alanyl-D-glutamate endopeptidase CwlK
MIDSRDINDLHPIVQAMARLHKDYCKEAGFDILIYATYRDHEFQDSLYAKGRTVKGSIVTNAKGGQSFHNWRVAYDAVPLRDGKPVWNNKTKEDKELWNKMGELGELVGLEWGGRWKFVDMPHFQHTQGLTYQDFASGKNIS